MEIRLIALQHTVQRELAHYDDLVVEIEDALMPGLGLGLVRPDSELEGLA